MSKFMEAWEHAAQEAHDCAVQHGFWQGEKNKAEMLALIHSEVSEALEALRRPVEQQDAKCPLFKEVEVELADVIIRIMDMAWGFNWNVAGAVEAKIQYNFSRPFKHGKVF